MWNRLRDFAAYSLFNLAFLLLLLMLLPSPFLLLSDDVDSCGYFYDRIVHTNIQWKEISYIYIRMMKIYLCNTEILLKMMLALHILLSQNEMPLDKNTSWRCCQRKNFYRTKILVVSSEKMMMVVCIFTLPCTCISIVVVYTNTFIFNCIWMYASV